MRQRVSYQRQASSAVARGLTTYRGSCYPLAPQHRTLMGPYAGSSIQRGKIIL
jgi:hypothetical protein